MEQAGTIGLDFAKPIVPAHGADALGRAVSASGWRGPRWFRSLMPSRRAWWRWRHAPGRTIGHASTASWGIRRG